MCWVNLKKRKKEFKKEFKLQATVFLLSVDQVPSLLFCFNSVKISSKTEFKPVLIIQNSDHVRPERVQDAAQHHKKVCFQKWFALNEIKFTGSGSAQFTSNPVVSSLRSACGVWDADRCVRWWVGGGVSYRRSKTVGLWDRGLCVCTLLYDLIICQPI